MRIIQLILDILFPAVCAGCAVPLGPDRRDLSVCSRCTELLGGASAFVCPVCRGRVPLAGAGRLPAISRLCHPQADYLLFALTSYDQPSVANLIRGLKFGRKAAIAGVLGQSAAASVRQFAGALDAIVPVPLSDQSLSDQRHRQRGFNQAELIARPLAAALSLPLLAEVCIRVRSTRPQTLLPTRLARHRNVADCFSVAEPEAVRGRTVLVVDDVWTSGATLEAVAARLKDAGARRVIGLVVARAR
jgi:ComF family protein